MECTFSDCCHLTHWSIWLFSWPLLRSCRSVLKWHRSHRYLLGWRSELAGLACLFVCLTMFVFRDNRVIMIGSVAPPYYWLQIELIIIYRPIIGRRFENYNILAPNYWAERPIIGRKIIIKCVDCGWPGLWWFSGENWTRGQYCYWGLFRVPRVYIEALMGL